MAQVVAAGSPFTLPQQPHAPHGTKRPAESCLENEQRLSKRFDLLNLGTCKPRRQSQLQPLTANAVDNNGTRLYIPVPGSTDASLPRQAYAIAAPHPLASTMPLKKRERTLRP